MTKCKAQREGPNGGHQETNAGAVKGGVDMLPDVRERAANLWQEYTTGSGP